MSFPVDETPTPTKLLEKLEKNGVFDQLGDVNPFDEQFRKATESGSQPTIPEPNTGKRTDDVLHTPIFHVMSENLQKYTSKISSCPSFPAMTDFLVPTPVIRDDASPEPDSRPTVAQPAVVETNNGTANVEAIKTSARPRFVKQTSVIVCPPGVEHPLTSHQEDDNQNVVDTSDFLFGLSSNSSSDREVTLSDIRNMKMDPLGIANGLARTQPDLGGLSAKEKLRQILRKDPSEDVFNLNSAQLFMNNSGRHFSVTTNCLPSESSDTKKRRKSEATLSDEDPDEKKRASLERNRAAAQRSRLKRKQQMVEMKKSNELLILENRRAKEEAASLRHEVAQLKSLLLAHKDCPVTHDILEASLEGVASMASSRRPESGVSNTPDFQTFLAWLHLPDTSRRKRLSGIRKKNLEGRLNVELPVQEKQVRLPNFVNIRPAEEQVQSMIVVLTPPDQHQATRDKVSSQSVIVGPRRPIQQFKIIQPSDSSLRRRMN